MNDPKDVLLVAFAGWIALHADMSRHRDHACAQCFPGGPIVIEGFQCVPHMARAMCRNAPTEQTGTEGDGGKDAP